MFCIPPPHGRVRRSSEHFRTLAYWTSVQPGWTARERATAYDRWKELPSRARGSYDVGSILGPWLFESSTRAPRLPPRAPPTPPPPAPRWQPPLKKSVELKKVRFKKKLVAIPSFATRRRPWVKVNVAPEIDVSGPATDIGAGFRPRHLPAGARAEPHARLATWNCATRS